MSSLKTKAKTFPNSPGVYIFSDTSGEPLYIGRATSLRQRTASYFRTDVDSRIAEMVARAKDINCDPTETVLDAIVLEANLIKKHWPKYNIKDKNHRSFTYIVIPKTDYPRPIMIRGRELKKFPPAKAKIFGPYQNVNLVRKALRLIRRVFPYSTCSPSGRACFNYQIGLCPGLCRGDISKKDYRANIKSIELLLSGERKRLMKQLAKDNPDQAESLKHLQDASLITHDDDKPTNGFQRIEGYDISHLTGKETYGSMVVFSDGEADKAEYRLFKIKAAPAGDDLRALTEVLTRRLNHTEWDQPDLIMIDGGKPQIDFVYKMFTEKNIKIPLVGISKYAGDKLVFPPKYKKQIKELITSNKPTLLKAREEAHRFSRKASRKKRSIKNT